MGDSANFNYEFLESNGGDIEAIKKYCTSRQCSPKGIFDDPDKLPCKSDRDGKCMMREYYMRKGDLNGKSIR